MKSECNSFASAHENLTAKILYVANYEVFVETILTGIISEIVLNLTIDRGFQWI